MSSNNFKNEEWFGVAKLFQEKPKGAPNWYWRVTCRKSKCPKELKSKNFSGEGAYERAKQWAKLVDSLIDYSSKIDVSPEVVAEFGKIEKQIQIDLSLKAFDDGKLSKIDSEIDSTHLKRIVENGILFTKALDNVNKIRTLAGEETLDGKWAVDSWKNHIKETTKPENTIDYKTAIAEFIKVKSSPTGAKNKRKLEGGLTEWKTIIQNYLTDWIGDKKLSNPKILKILIDKISHGKKENGDLWSESYRNRIASKVKGFGIWLQKENQLKSNPFENLPEEFPEPDKEMVSYFSTKEVRIILEAALKTDGGRMLDYYVFLFFSTLRPFEIAHQKIATRRLKYDSFEGWKFRHSNPEGYEWVYKKYQKIAGKIVRRSKTKDRTPILLDIGAEWLKFKYGNLPIVGEVGWWRKTQTSVIRKLKEETGKAWPQDGARHTLLSYSRRYPSFRSIQSYWAWVAGHDPETFKQYYSAPVTEEESVDFFENIRPPWPVLESDRTAVDLLTGI